MKILVVAPEQIPVPGRGSVEICILAIAKKLAEHHQVTVVSRELGNLTSHSKVVDGVNTFRVASGSSKMYLSSVLRKVAVIACANKLIHHIYAILSKNEPYHP
ncbi:hypothetical protein Q8I65_16940 [Paenibacillus ottowii]|uniref:hypothetical protein n=1 Tax=Paenibacillus ottowii TaxID=2315729 RepID=UPI0027313DD3|nr:hypothetical protein [Paenibacillus ottowii]MDP1511882.1 hypothetical protein [Paenibacillus ottowii]